MKDKIDLEEFKTWLEANNYGFVTSPMNTRHSVMFDAYKAGKRVGFDRGINSVR